MARAYSRGSVLCVSTLLLLAPSVLSASDQAASPPPGICCAIPRGPSNFSKMAAARVDRSAPNFVGMAVLTFEGLLNSEPIGDYYNGAKANGGTGSGPGPSYGISFSSNALALIASSAGGGGNFGGEPSPVTTLFFLTGTGAVMNVPAGFSTGFSFYYAAPGQTGTITVYDDVNAAGNLLATLPLPLTPLGVPPAPPYDPFLPIGVSFSGVAKSVNFGGAANFIAFDNITLGSQTPQGFAEGVVPTLSTTGLLLVASLLGLAGFRALRSA